jgi:hypothetical protein
MTAVADHFEKVFQPYCQQKLIGNSTEGMMSKSEMMSIYIFYHLSGMRCFNRVAGAMVLSVCHSAAPH